MQGVYVLMTDSLGEEDRSIRPAELLSLYNAGFKLVPLTADGITTAIPWSAVYENPGYWTPQMLVSQHSKFRGVATVFGRSRLVGPCGEALHHHCIDMDSQAVYEIVNSRLNSINGQVGQKAAGLIRTLQNLQNGSRTIDGMSFLEILRQTTFVTKTHKKHGYHVHWFEPTTHDAIFSQDCKRGSEFEIKTGKASVMQHYRLQDIATFPALGIKR
jgi:hypothetical protein